jgi:hypothetical protein
VAGLDVAVPGFWVCWRVAGVWAMVVADASRAVSRKMKRLVILMRRDLAFCGWLGLDEGEDIVFMVEGN